MKILGGIMLLLPVKKTNANLFDICIMYIVLLNDINIISFYTC